MKIASKIPVCGLIAILAVATLAAGAVEDRDRGSRVVAGNSEPGAGCHGHRGGNSPQSAAPHSPVPVKYDCCLTGHDVAAVAATYQLHPSTFSARVSRSVPDTFPSQFSKSSDFPPVSTVHPPGATPLRI
jgi:hypothetical protein